MEQPSLSSQILLVEEQINGLKKRCQELEDIIESKDEKIFKLKTKLKLETFKSRFFSRLLEENTSLKIGDIYQEKDGSVNINNFPDGTIPVIVHDILETKTYQITKVRKNKKKAGPVFRSVKNQVELASEEDVKKQEEKVKQVETEMAKIIDVSLKETNENLEKLFVSIKESRTVKKALLESVKEQRTKLLGKLKLDEYTSLVSRHVNILEEIYHKKKLEKKRLIPTITQSLSPLDARLTFYGQYYKMRLEIDEIDRLDKCIEVNMGYWKRYTPFSSSDLCEKICNYGLCTFSLVKTMKRVLKNPYGFSNIVYLDKEKSIPEDPFRFYSLEKVDNGKRCWKMECRLEEMSEIISEPILNYCITLFRKIYSDIFSDNVYRSDYREKHPILEQDCRQLIVTILELSTRHVLCNIMRDIVVKNCTISPTDMDKFNLTKDDTINKSKFKEHVNDEPDRLTSIKRLFDGISVDEAQEVLQNEFSNY